MWRRGRGPGGRSGRGDEPRPKGARAALALRCRWPRRGRLEVTRHLRKAWSPSVSESYPSELRGCPAVVEQSARELRCGPQIGRDQRNGKTRPKPTNKCKRCPALSRLSQPWANAVRNRTNAQFMEQLLDNFWVIKCWTLPGDNFPGRAATSISAVSW